MFEHLDDPDFSGPRPDTRVHVQNRARRIRRSRWVAASSAVAGLALMTVAVAVVSSGPDEVRTLDPVESPSPTAASSEPTTGAVTPPGGGRCRGFGFSTPDSEQNGTVHATPAAPASLTVAVDAAQLKGGGLTEIRVDVLPIGHTVYGNEDRLLDGDEPHVRRFEATDEQLASARAHFLFDGRDDDGELLPEGRYQVGVVIRGEVGGACAGRPVNAYGALTTVRWTP